MPTAISSGPTSIVAAVDGGDDEQRDDVVDDDDRQQEAAQPVGEARADQGEHAEREGGVGRHRHAPALGRVVAGVEGEVDRDRDDHPAEGGEHRQGQAAALAQLADVELAPHLEPDDEEEERHQAVVDPVAQVLGDARGADLDRERRCARRSRRRRGRCWPRRAPRPPPPAGRRRCRSRCARKSRSGACRLRAQAVRPLNLDWVAASLIPAAFHPPVTLVRMRRMLQLVLLSAALAICGAVPAQAALTPTITSFPSSDPLSTESHPYAIAAGRDGAALVHRSLRNRRSGG